MGAVAFEAEAWPSYHRTSSPSVQTLGFESTKDSVIQLHLLELSLCEEFAPGILCHV